jgi:hypothetical protein
MSIIIPIIALIICLIAIIFWAPVYVRYAKDNPQGLWFKRKLYGWGWTPVKWQGWLVILGYIVLVFLSALTIDDSSPRNEVAFTFVLPVILLTSALIIICYKKGEKPRWQWGEHKDL